MRERNPQPPEANEGLEAEASDAAAIFTALFLKYTFLGIFWPIYLLKSAFFKCLTKVC